MFLTASFTVFAVCSAWVTVWVVVDDFFSATFSVFCYCCSFFWLCSSTLLFYWTVCVFSALATRSVSFWDSLDFCWFVTAYFLGVMASAFGILTSAKCLGLSYVCPSFFWISCSLVSLVFTSWWPWSMCTFNSSTCFSEFSRTLMSSALTGPSSCSEMSCFSWLACFWWAASN